LESPVTEDEILKALQLTPGIQSRQSEKDPWRRALNWYVRGVSDSDRTDKFIDFWISLETLSQLYDGHVEPYRCPHCDEITNPRPDARVVLAFLSDLKIKMPGNLVNVLTKIRGPLFHDAKAMKEAQTIQALLKSVLSECLIKTLPPVSLGP
jgi:hypothetical protein